MRGIHSGPPTRKAAQKRTIKFLMSIPAGLYDELITISRTITVKTIDVFPMSAVTETGMDPQQ